MTSGMKDEVLRDEKSKSPVFAFIVITGLFFIWGFMTSMNDILIPYLKQRFVLNYFEATLVQFAFFGAYLSDRPFIF